MTGFQHSIRKASSGSYKTTPSLFSLLAPVRVFLILFGFITHACLADELHLLCWTEYVPPAIVHGFEQKAKVKVTIEYYNSNEEMLSKLKSRSAYYDLVQPSGFYVETLVERDGLEPLDYSHIPNAHYLDPHYRHLSHDPKNRYSVPWMAGTMGIVVNTARIKEPVKTWADVFNGKYAGHIVVVDDNREMVAWALASLNMPITDVSDNALEKVRPVLEKWLPQVAVFDSDSPKDTLLSGKADIGIVWSGEAAALWLRDHKYRYIIPKEGAHMFVDSLAIPSGAPHKRLAEDFINYCLEPEVSVLISRAYPYTNPNLAARKLLSAEERANPASYPTDKLDLHALRNHGNTTKTVYAFVQRIRERVLQPNGGQHEK